MGVSAANANIRSFDDDLSGLGYRRVDLTQVELRRATHQERFHLVFVTHSYSMCRAYLYHSKREITDTRTGLGCARDFFA
ncbi:hypothetical protein D3C85_1561140 [compost metagenome]